MPNKNKCTFGILNKILNILHAKTDIIQKSYNPYDIKTHFRHNIKKCALCNKEILQINFYYNFISVRLK